MLECAHTPILSFYLCPELLHSIARMLLLYTNAPMAGYCFVNV